MSTNLDKDIQTILVTETELDRVTFRIASEIDRDYQNAEHLVLLCILKGSIVFTGELMRKLTIPSEIDFMKVSSYGSGTVSTGRVNIVLDIMRSDLNKCDILIIEDIIDSGRTLSYLAEYLKLKGAKSVKTCALLGAENSHFVNPHGLDAEGPYSTAQDLANPLTSGAGFDTLNPY